jgi:hypothetical protein
VSCSDTEEAAAAAAAGLAQRRFVAAAPAAAASTECAGGQSCSVQPRAAVTRHCDGRPVSRKRGVRALRSSCSSRKRRSAASAVAQPAPVAAQEEGDTDINATDDEEVGVTQPSYTGAAAAARASSPQPMASDASPCTNVGCLAVSASLASRASSRQATVVLARVVSAPAIVYGH